MTVAVVCNPDLEKFLAACRLALLRGRRDRTARPALLGFACALARQCYINEYVYATDRRRGGARARHLRDRLEAALAAGAAVPPLWVAMVGSLFPVARASLRRRRCWRGHGPIRSQRCSCGRCASRARRRRCAPRIPQLTPIEDATSQAVQAQYETNPYPRWVSTAVPQPFASVETFLREMLPAAPVRASAKSGSPDVLIAGCGTGQHAIMTARQYRDARARDRPEPREPRLCAARTRALGLDIEYAQADIMRLGALGRNFDLIESNGVLHHMADPYAGWRVLLSLLRPGGFMRIGLYSERARWGVVEARAFIAQARLWRDAGRDPALPPRPDAARRRTGRDAMARNIMWFNDFYSTSECRDLLFHVQEHRMTLPQIKAFLVAQDAAIPRLRDRSGHEAPIRGALSVRHDNDRP